MKIRHASPDDFQALVAIGHKFYEHNVYRHHMPLDEKSLLKTFTDLSANHLLLVVEVEGEVVGTAAAFIAPLYWNRRYLQGVEAFWWIDEEHRGNGAGKKLRQYLQAAAKLRGAGFWNMIALEDSQPEAVGAMYEKAGLKLVEHVYMKVI